MKFITAIAALFVAAVANAQVYPAFVVCPPGTGYDLTVTGFSLSPYPLCVGKQVCATVTGTLANPIIAPSDLTITGKYLGRVVYTDAHDLCAVLAASGHPCPVPTTVTSITACITVKPTAPTGIPVLLRIEATNGNGNPLFCVETIVTAQTCP